MFSQVTSFLFGPFCYPVFLASFLHAIDFFVNFAAPKSIDSDSQSQFPHVLAIDLELQSAGEPKERK